MPIGIVHVLILAVIQGLTEFLPVSSSGHLVLAEAFLGLRESERMSGVMFEIAVHVGTLGAVIAVYHRRMADIGRAACSFAVGRFRVSGGDIAEIRYIGYILVASVPAAFAGLLLRDHIARIFDSPAITSALLVVTGCFLLASRRGPGAGGALSVRTAFIVGVAQAIAILPGCSRSGWTITTALLLGLGFERAAEFSFLMSVPAILGALAVELAGNRAAIAGGELPAMAIGAATAFFSGWFALRLVIRILGNGTFYRFAWYLIPAGLLGVIYFLTSG